jgi:ActR/RegA family two-component response regulator
MRSSRRLLMVCCLFVASFGINSRTPALAQEKASRPELQQQFNAALKSYNDGQYDKASAALDRILQMNPSSHEAMDLLEKSDMGILVKMLQEPKVGAQVRILLRKSEEEAANLPHDPATIKALIEKTGSDDIVAHWSAIRQLTAIGPFAVPQLLDEALSIERLTRESRRLASFVALRAMGPAATPPLIVALRDGGDSDADAIATMIAKSPDARAVPPLAAIVENPARPDNVRKAASDALAAIVSEPGRAARNAADAYYRLAQRYYYADPALLALTSDANRGIWRWNPEGKNFAERLVFEPLSAAAFPRLMAADAIQAGMAQKHSSPDLIELDICNNYMMLEDAAALKDKAPDPQTIKATNESLGAEYLYAALGRLLKDNNQPLARRCVEALADIGDPRPPRENTLISAVAYPDKFVRIEAALALIQLSPMGELGGTGETARAMAASLGAPVRPRAGFLTDDADLFQRLAKAIQGPDLSVEMHKKTGDAVRQVKEIASPLSVLVLDARVEGNEKSIALVNALHADRRSSKLPIILLAAPGDVEKLRAAGGNQIASVLPLNADPAQVKSAISNAAGSARNTAAEENVRENVMLVRRILQALASLPSATRYPAQDLSIAAAGFLTNQPNDMRVLALRAIGNLPQPALRDPVFDIFVSSSEPVEVRREAGAALQKLLVANPRITPQQQAQLRSLINDADDLLRTCAIHGLALASIPQGEREAAIATAEKTAPQTPPAAQAPAAPASVAPQAAAQPDPREKPETAIAEWIRLLEAKDYKSFVQEFTPPEALALLLSMSKMTIEDLAKDIGEKSSADVLQALKAAKDVKPEMSADGQKATFKLKEPVDGHDSFSLVRIEKFWYMANK